MYLDMNLNEYIKETEKGVSAPGGGSVNGLVGSLGAALTLMGGNFTFGKDEFESLDDNKREEFTNNFNEISEINEELKKIIYEDTVAFNDVLVAFKLENKTKEQKELRSKAIEKGYMKSIEVPERCMNLSLKVMELQKPFILYGNKNLIVDIGVGAILAYAALEGSYLNIKTNLNGIKDEKVKEEIINNMEEKISRGKKLKEEIIELVESKI